MESSNGGCWRNCYRVFGHGSLASDRMSSAWNTWNELAMTKTQQFRASDLDAGGFFPNLSHFRSAPKMTRWMVNHHSFSSHRPIAFISRTQVVGIIFGVGWWPMTRWQLLIMALLPKGLRYAAMHLSAWSFKRIDWWVLRLCEGDKGIWFQNTIGLAESQP